LLPQLLQLRLQGERRAFSPQIRLTRSLSVKASLKKHPFSERKDPAPVEIFISNFKL